MTVFLPSGDEIIVDEPNDYYLSRNDGLRTQIPVLAPGESVTIRIELETAYADTDYVALTYGANRTRFNRAKKIFELVSSELIGDVYRKVYEQTYTSHQFPGYYHAVISAVPWIVVNDDAAPVESNSWAIPYRIVL